MAAVERDGEESPKTKLSTWDWRVARADSVTQHPWETGRYDLRDVGDMCVGMCALRNCEIY